MDQFFQQGPSFSHPYDSDQVLQGLLKVFCADEKKLATIQKDLKRFGDRLVSEVEKLGEKAESHPPEHIPYDPWGRRIDRIRVDPAWDELDKVSAEEGLIALGYKRDGDSSHRLHQLAKIYLFHPSSAFYSCPLAMSDGAAKLIEVCGDKELKEGAFRHLTSTDPEEFWTSGQWMTERTGGSDVGHSETTARFENGEWRLYGTKWFTSATTSQMAMTLARIEDENGETKEGSRGLSLFYIEVRDREGHLKNIRVNRLKDKLGTKALPTAELTLEGIPAKLIGEQGRGVPLISNLFNVTRIYNACTTVGAYRRLMELANDYAEKRMAFGKLLKDHPLHQRTLGELDDKLTGITTLAFYVVELLGRSEVLPEGEEKDQVSKLLRLLTPIAKLYTAKLNMQATTELIESFGGAGFIEDTGLPRWLRDAPVFCIWEGTTNVLSLDVLRALEKDQSFEILSTTLRDSLTKIQNTGQYSEFVSKAQSELGELEKAFKNLAGASREDWEWKARDLAFALGTLTQNLLVAHCACSDKLSKKEKEPFVSAVEHSLKESWVNIAD